MGIGDWGLFPKFKKMKKIYFKLINNIIKIFIKMNIFKKYFEHLSDNSLIFH